MPTRRQPPKPQRQMPRPPPTAPRPLRLPPTAPQDLQRRALGRLAEAVERRWQRPRPPVSPLMSARRRLGRHQCPPPEYQPGTTRWRPAWL